MAQSDKKPVKFKADKNPKDVRAAIYDYSAIKGDTRVAKRMRETERYFSKFGYKNMTVYTDVGSDGENPDRTAFGAMCADIEAGKIEAVLVFNMFCFHGLETPVGIWLEEMYAKGIIVLMVGETPDFSAQGEFTRQFETLAFQYPSRTSERIKEAMGRRKNGAIRKERTR